MGRSTSITGAGSNPYKDKDGYSMLTGDGIHGGTLFLGTDTTTGRYGPGQISIISQGGTEYYSYHYYSTIYPNGAYGISRLYWTDDGWPSADVTPSIWSGASTSNNHWSTNINWNGQAPATNSDLQFGNLVSGGYGDTVSDNDVSGTPQYTALHFLSTSAAYTLQGLPIRLTGLIVNSSANNQVVNLNVFFDTGSGSIDTSDQKTHHRRRAQRRNRRLAKSYQNRFRRTGLEGE